MKLALGTALLVLLAGTTMYAQEQDKDKPAPHEGKKQEPAAKEHEQPKAQEQQKTQDQQKAQHQAQEQQKDHAKQTEKERSDAAKQQQQAAHQQQQPAAKQQQQQVARQDHAQEQQAQRDGGNHNARRVPEQDFHAHFGREHTFRVARNNDRRFNYGGYYWTYNDPWPSGWAYTDAVYVDEIDGEYYLIDPVHPGVQLLIIVAS
jgi:hypothetical protein